MEVENLQLQVIRVYLILFCKIQLHFLAFTLKLCMELKYRVKQRKKSKIVDVDVTNTHAIETSSSLTSTILQINNKIKILRGTREY